MRANWTETAGMWISDLQTQVRTSQTFHRFSTPRSPCLRVCVCVCVRVVFSPQMPEEEVSYLAVGLGTLQQEVGECAVVVRLIAQHLHQL